MELQYSELENGIRLIKLLGRLDIIGAGQIACQPRWKDGIVESNA